MAIKLSDIERQRSLAKPPEKLQAYDYLMRGRDDLRRNTHADNREARNLFEQAISLDPSYASAYSALAETRLTAAESGWVDLVSGALDQAESLARKALELDSSNAQAHAVLGDVYLNREKYDLARAEDDEAIALNPNDANSHASRGGVLLFSGEAEEAVKSFEVAMRLNPSMENTTSYPIGWAYYLVRRYADAAHVMERSLLNNPDNYFTHAGLAATYAQLGRTEGAARAAQKTLTTYPFFSVDVFVYQFHRQSDRAAIADGLRKAGLK
jgi:adenylate cyclase